MLTKQAVENLLWSYHNTINDDLCEWAFWETLECLDLKEEFANILAKESE